MYQLDNKWFVAYLYDGILYNTKKYRPKSINMDKAQKRNLEFKKTNCKNMLQCESTKYLTVYITNGCVHMYIIKVCIHTEEWYTLNLVYGLPCKNGF
jgi:hypothetical protein